LDAALASMKTPALIKDEMEGVLKERILVHQGFYGKNERKLCKNLYVCARVFILFLLSKRHLNRIFMI
jgi:hypothetical protein